jgi:glycosyltransferase involved in cell wall biosynthesis
VQASELSVLIPAKNIEEGILRIITFTAEQLKGIDAEIIIVDMGSSDKTVLQAVTQLKGLGLHGFVIQNGNSDVPSALNTAVQKACGKYLTFFFARRLYEGLLRPYLETAKRTNADFVFGCSSKEEARVAELRNVSSAVHHPDGAFFAESILHHRTKIDIAAIMVRRDLLLSKQISFDENYQFGYAEEFLFDCLLNAGTAVQAATVLKRSKSNEIELPKNAPVGFSVFRRVEAVLRIISTVEYANSQNGELLRLLKKDTLPRAVMDSIDVVMREGMSRQRINAYLKSLDYDRLLTIDRQTDPNLKRRVILWKMMPWLYRPQ